MWLYNSVMKNQIGAAAAGFVGMVIALSPFAALASQQCVSLARTLSRGSRGNDVVLLQNFLVTQGLLSSDNATGYFGALTESSVQRFQCIQHVTCEGTPDTTGYGVAGRVTRSVIRSTTCGSGSSGTTTTGSSGSSWTELKTPTGSGTNSSAITNTNWTTDAKVSSGGGAASIPASNSQQQSGQVSAPSVSSCVSYDTTYREGDTTSCSMHPGPGIVCPLGLPTLSWKCTRGEWINVPSSGSNSVVAPCSFNGQTIQHGSSVQAYRESSAAQCVYETRTCTNGTLSGTYQNVSCTVQTAPQGSGVSSSGGDCVVHRNTSPLPAYNCADIVIPNGHTARNSRQCGVVCVAPVKCIDGALVSVGDYSTPAEYELACPNSPYSL